MAWNVRDNCWEWKAKLGITIDYLRLNAIARSINEKKRYLAVINMFIILNR